MGTVNKTLLFIVFFFISGSVSGNGMGTYAVSATVRSSDPICREIKDIVLLSEKLAVNLNSGYSEITVNYVLWNQSNSDYTDIDYAFPVDYLAGGYNSEYSNLYSIKNISFRCNDVSLDFARSEAKIIDKTGVDFGIYENDLYIENNNLYRQWYYTRFSIKKNSFAHLEVTYSLSNQYLCDGDSPLNHDYFYGCRTRRLIYDFSPASCWGDGIIRDFYVEVESRDLKLAGDNNREYHDEDIPLVTGLDFQQEGTRFVYRTRNFDLKNSQPLYICYSASEISSVKMLTDFLISPSLYSVRTSGERKSYPLTNITDMNLETTWVDKGTGDWIEFSFDGTIRLAGICIVNGYQKSADTYMENNRVKTGKLTLETEEGIMEIILTFGDPEYQQIYFENLFYHSFYYDFFDFPLIKSVKLSIEEVYAGTKYDDTCISEIMFFK